MKGCIFMKRAPFAIFLLMVLLLSACEQRQDFSETDAQEPDDSAVQFSEEKHFSFERTTFYYDGQSYDVTSRVEAINSILSVVPVGEKIAIECHVGPKNGVYLIFDTVSKSFEADILGNHLIWYHDDITTAVYSFWSDIYSYDGDMIKSYDLAEDEFIYDLIFSDDYAQLIVTIVCGNGKEQIDIIDL